MIRQNTQCVNSIVSHVNVSQDVDRKKTEKSEMAVSAEEK